MNSNPARYDAIADWYVEFTKDWGSLNAVLRAGLALEEVAERGSLVPVTLIARCRRLD